MIQNVCANRGVAHAEPLQDGELAAELPGAGAPGQGLLQGRVEETSENIRVFSEIYETTIEYRIGWSSPIQ
jgi:hypothetical protein